jgi:predicted membrane protein
MSKPLLGLILGVVLGFLDGLSAFFYPDVASMMTGIIIGSTTKGLLTGVAAGFFANRFRSLPVGIAFGLALGLVLSFLVAATGPDPHYYVEIMLPGSILGAVVGFATQRFGRAAGRVARA